MIQSNKQIISLVLIITGLACIQPVQAMKERAKQAGFIFAERGLSEMAKKSTEHKLAADVGSKLVVRSSRVGPTQAMISVGTEKLISALLSRYIPNEAANLVASSITYYTLDNFDWSVFRLWDYNERSLRKFQTYLKLNPDTFIDLERSCGGWQSLAAFSESVLRSRINKRVIEPAKINYKKHLLGVPLRIATDAGAAYTSDTLKKRVKMPSLVSKVPEKVEAEKTEEQASPISQAGKILKDIVCEKVAQETFQRLGDGIESRLLPVQRPTSSNKDWEKFLQSLSDGLKNQLSIFEQEQNYPNGVLTEYKDFCCFCFYQMLGSLKRFMQGHMAEDIQSLLNLEQAHVEALKVIEELSAQIQRDINKRADYNKNLMRFSLLLQKNHTRKFFQEDCSQVLDYFSSMISTNQILKDLLLYDTSWFMCKCLADELNERLKFITIKKEEAQQAIQESNELE